MTSASVRCQYVHRLLTDCSARAGVRLRSWRVQRAVVNCSSQSHVICQQEAPTSKAAYVDVARRCKLSRRDYRSAGVSQSRRPATGTAGWCPTVTSTTEVPADDRSWFTVPRRIASDLYVLFNCKQSRSNHSRMAVSTWSASQLLKGWLGLVGCVDSYEQLSIVGKPIIRHAE